VAESPEKIRDHIEVLASFERLYDEFVRLLAEDRRSDFGPRNTAQLGRMQREILESAPRADIAAKASGHWVTTTNPPMMGGGLRSDSLTGQVMDIDEPGFTDDGLRIPRMILQAIPIQLGALRMKLEEAEKGKPTRAERQDQRRSSSPPSDSPKSKPSPPQSQRHLGGTPTQPWHERPLFVGIVTGLIATVGGGLILAAILGAFH
jgi:hypothetical protein